MRSRFMLTAVAVSLASVVAIGCGDDGDTGTTGTTAGGATGGFDGTLTVGALVPLTGDLASFGAVGLKAADLAVEQFNDAAESAGFDGTVELAHEDSQTTPEGGVSAAQKLVRSENASCIAGDWPSSATIAVAEGVTVPEQVPLVSPSSTSPEITDLDDDGYVFRTAPSDVLQAQVLANSVFEDIGEGGTVNVAAINNAYGQPLAEQFKSAAEELGLTVNGPVLYDPAQAQFDADARRMVQGEHDAFVIIEYADAWQKVGSALARTGNWDPANTWTVDGLKSTTLPADAGREITEGMRGTAPTSTDAPAGAAFDELWKSTNQGKRQTYDAQNFDAVVLCSLAAVSAGSTEGVDIAERLRDVSSAPGEKITFENLDRGIELLLDGEDIDYEGASGPIDWDDNGDPQASNYEIWAYRNGQFEVEPGVVEFSAETGIRESDGTTTDGTTTDTATDSTVTTE